MYFRSQNLSSLKITQMLNIILYTYIGQYWSTYMNQSGVKNNNGNEQTVCWVYKLNQRSVAEFKCNILHRQ